MKELSFYLNIYGDINVATYEYLKQTNVLQVSVVSEFTSRTFNLGDVVYSKGFYETGDGGGAQYEIVKDAIPDKYTIFETANGLYAKLMVKKSMNVLQFGAIPLDIDIYDESKTSHIQLLMAFSSGVIDLYFPNNKNFLISEKTIIQNINLLNIVGNGSTIFTDNGFVLPEETYPQSYLMISNCQNISYDNLNMVCRETISKYPMEFQLRIVDSINIEVRNSTFRGPGAFLKKNNLQDLKNGINLNEKYYESEKYIELPEDINMTNIDVYSGCQNIYIDNCELYLSHDGPAGLCYMVRDIHGKSTSNVHFTNNYCEKISHDEIIATGMSGAILSDLYFENNTFVMYDGIRTKSLIAVSFGSGAVAEKISNLYVRNNNFFIQSSLYGIVFEMIDVVGSDAIFEGNYVDSSSGGNTDSSAFYGIRTLPDSDSKILLSEENEFHIRNVVGVQKTIECFRNINMYGYQKIYTYGNISSVVNTSDYIKNCTFISTDKISIFFSKVHNISNNNILMDFATYLIQYAGALGSIVMEQNRIEYLKEITLNYFNLRLYSATINNDETITIRDNEYVLPNPERGGSYLVDSTNSTYPETPYGMIIFENNISKKSDGTDYDFYLAYRFVRGIGREYIISE